MRNSEVVRDVVGFYLRIAGRVGDGCRGVGLGCGILGIAEVVAGGDKGVTPTAASARLPGW